MDDPRICKKCLLREMAEADREQIQSYIDVIKMRDRVDPSCYEQRLALCKQCEKLFAGTCQSCGCYVEIRALLKNGRCPNRVWERSICR